MDFSTFLLLVGNYMHFKVRSMVIAIQIRGIIEETVGFARQNALAACFRICPSFDK